MARHFRELIVWRKAMQLAEAVYSVTQPLPPEEKFGLSRQLRRAAVSIPSNIAEGHERRSRADYRRFITMACGSLAEVETQLELAQRLHQPDAASLQVALDLCDETGRLLRAIERGLRTRTIADQSTDYDPA
jgi:four helix bundle protein